MKKRWALIVALLLQLSITLGLGTIAAYANGHDRAPKGLIVWGKDFSGLSKAEVLFEIKSMIPSAISYKGRSYPLKTGRTEAAINKWLDQIFPVSSGSQLADAIHILERSNVKVSPDSIGLNREEIIKQLEDLRQYIDEPIRLSTITFSNGNLETTFGQSGKKLDVEKTWLKISQEHNSKQVEAVVEEMSAKPEASDIKKIQNILGDYTTYFNPQDISRTKNVRLAAAALDNRLIPPGQVFSFNDIVGERTEAAGYLPAIIFVDQSMVKGDGGGVCQDSSTLYKAVCQAHLAIEERHTHSLPVSYVPKDKDATVAYGLLDFRFRNDTSGYLLISACTGQNWLRIRLFGIADSNHPALELPDGYPGPLEN